MPSMDHRIAVEPRDQGFLRVAGIRVDQRAGRLSQGLQIEPSEISLINSLPGRRTCCSRLVTQSALFEELLHWLPIRFDPSAGMTVESVRRYANLRKAKLRATIQLAQVECGY